MRASDVPDVVDAVVRDQRIANGANHFIDARVDRDTLTDSFRRRPTPTWVARDTTRLRGHLTATTLTRPSGHVSAWISPDAVSFDDPATLGALYAAAGAEWLRGGVDDHQAWVYDRPDAREPWFELGFALRFRRGSLDLSARDVAELQSGYDLRRGTLDDLDLSMHFNRLLDDEEYVGPAFARPEPLSREETEETLGEPDTNFVVVEHRGTPVAQCIAFPLLPVRGARPRTLHLSAVVVEPSHRGRGVATAMLDRVLAEARQSGFEFADVTWRTANPGAAAFWSAYGVTPTYVRLQRRIERD